MKTTSERLRTAGNMVLAVWFVSILALVAAMVFLVMVAAIATATPPDPVVPWNPGEPSCDTSSPMFNINQCQLDVIPNSPARGGAVDHWPIGRPYGTG